MLTIAPEAALRSSCHSCWKIGRPMVLILPGDITETKLCTPSFTHLTGYSMSNLKSNCFSVPYTKM